jgi:hypothetical protein
MLQLAGRIALIVLLLLAGTLAVAVWLAEPALRLALRLTGVETVRFEDLHLGPAAVEPSSMGARRHSLSSAPLF